MKSLIIGVIVLMLIVTVVWFIKTSNKINQYLVKINEAQSSIEIALVKRYDVLKQSANCVKKYAEHESSIFNNLVEVRRGMSIDQLQKAANNHAAIMDRLFAVGEAYPNLKADTVYVTLQRSISEENEHLAAAKRMYNGNVSSYNQLVRSFPASLVAAIKASRVLDFYAEENVAAKKEIELDL